MRCLKSVFAVRVKSTGKYLSRSRAMPTINEPKLWVRIHDARRAAKRAEWAFGETEIVQFALHEMAVVGEPAK